MTREQKNVGRRKRHIVLAVILAVIVLLMIGFATYVSDYYRANEYAVQAMASDGHVTVSMTEGGTILFAPDEPNAGLIFLLQRSEQFRFGCIVSLWF